MLALCARIQTLLRGHKYALFIFLWAVFGCWANLWKGLWEKTEKIGYPGNETSKD